MAAESSERRAFFHFFFSLFFSFFPKVNYFSLNIVDQYDMYLFRFLLHCACVLCVVRYCYLLLLFVLFGLGTSRN